MGILDIFGGKSPEEKARKLKPKATQKYGDPTVRQKAISQLGEMKHPEAVSALLARFTVSVDPGTTDVEEKEHVFSLVQSCGGDAVGPVKEFLFRSDAASSWAVRLLTALLPVEEVTGACIEALDRLGPEYTRDPEKKVVLIHYLSERSEDQRVPPALLPFLDDPSDEVKLAALRALGPMKYEPAREKILKLLTTPDTARRVQAAAISALHESGFSVGEQKSEVEALVTEPFFVDTNGRLAKRS